MNYASCTVTNKQIFFSLVSNLPLFFHTHKIIHIYGTIKTCQLLKILLSKKQTASTPLGITIKTHILKYMQTKKLFIDI